MKVFVTGSTGLVGRAVVADSVARAWEVVGVARSTDPALDLTDREATLAAVGAARPDVVVHCAAMADVDRCEREPAEAERQNVDATRHVVEAAAAVGAHVVHVSTDYVFDGTGRTPYRADDPTGPIQTYGRTKLRAEEVVLAAGGCVARTSWVSGVAGRSTVRSIVETARAGEPLRFITDQVGQPTVAADLADRLLGLGEARVDGVVHVSCLGPMSWFDLARTVVAAVGGDPDLVAPVTLAEASRDRPAPRPAYSVLDGASLTAAGLEPMPATTGAITALARRVRDGV